MFREIEKNTNIILNIKKKERLKQNQKHSHSYF